MDRATDAARSLRVPLEHKGEAERRLVGGLDHAEPLGGRNRLGFDVRLCARGRACLCPQRELGEVGDAHVTRLLPPTVTGEWAERVDGLLVKAWAELHEMQPLDEAQTAMAELVDGAQNDKAVRDYGRIEERWRLRRNMRRRLAGPRHHLLSEGGGGRGPVGLGSAGHRPGGGVAGDRCNKAVNKRPCLYSTCYLLLF